MSSIQNLGTLSFKKKGKNRGHCPLLATPPPKRVKRGHLSSDYRKKCVNGTRDILMLIKARKMTILAIIMFKENVGPGIRLGVFIQRLYRVQGSIGGVKMM